MAGATLRSWLAPRCANGGLRVQNEKQRRTKVLTTNGEGVGVELGVASQSSLSEPDLQLSPHPAPG